ncbi:TIGR02444 family protein [Salinicola aestuarinus]|uniref:TIGR02444 family protein n=1 Tax=Salinicola aestuarinus TaxID=1949082 RepID=UPI000DA1C733|nr:TIGR02444 family protein [Salinicola aestuarinus]
MPHAPLSLWSFALERYARPGTETLCLELQDGHGLDVCELLWSAWLAERELAVATEAPTQLEPIRRWQAEMTQPLRERRRALKPLVAATPSLDDLRQTLKRAELEAERETLRRLEALSAGTPAVPTSPVALALANCQRLGTLDAAAYPALRQLMTRWLEKSPDAEPNGPC